MKVEVAKETEKARKRVAVVSEVGELAKECGFRKLILAAGWSAIDIKKMQHPVLQSDRNLGQFEG